MTDILEYSKGTDKLENREDFLFQLLNDLDNESYQLFSEIMDLGDTSYYKIDNLYSRVKYIRDIYNKTVESFKYVGKIEQSSYDYAAMRFQLKRLLTAVTTVYAFMCNVLLGISAFVLLNQRASEDFVNELVYINSRMDKFNEEQLRKIGSTIDNCTRLLEKKLEDMNPSGDLFRIINDGSLEVTQVNGFIVAYIEELIDYDTIDTLSDKLKGMMISILQKDLNIDSDNLQELLEHAKRLNNDGLKLIKEYK